MLRKLKQALKPSQSLCQQAFVLSRACTGTGLEWVDQLLRHLNSDRHFREAALLTVVLTPAGGSYSQQPLLLPGGASWRDQAQGGASGRMAGSTEAPSGHTSEPSVSRVANSAVAVGAAGGTNQPGKQQHGSSSDGKAPAAAELPPATKRAKVEDCFPVLRPVQSFEQHGGAPIDVDTRQPLLVVRRLPGVMRRDKATRCSVAECLSKGGMGCILADRLIPEIAYKLGRAPKYGA